MGLGTQWRGPITSNNWAHMWFLVLRSFHVFIWDYSFLCLQKSGGLTFANQNRLMKTKWWLKLCCCLKWTSMINLLFISSLFMFISKLAFVLWEKTEENDTSVYLTCNPKFNFMTQKNWFTTKSSIHNTHLNSFARYIFVTFHCYS